MLIAELNSARIAFAIVAGIPMAVMLLAAVWLVPTWSSAVRAGSSVLLVGLIALIGWTFVQSAGQSAQASPPLATSVPRAQPTVPASPAGPSSPARPSSPAGPASPAAPEAPCSPSGPSVSVAARNLAFDKECLAAPADAAFTIRFDNADPGVPHNVAVLSGGRAVFTGDIVTGPKVVTYRVNALQAGRYEFHCDVHPQMHGEFVVQ